MRIDESLQYLAAQDVDNVAGDASVTIESPDGFELGRLDGFMVDPQRHALRYYVVSRFGAWGMKLGLVPFVPGCLDAEHGVLRLLDHATPQPLG